MPAFPSSQAFQSSLTGLLERVANLEAGYVAAPLAAENTVNVGTGDGVTLSFAFPDSPVTRVDLVLVGNIPQTADKYSFTDTHLLFGAGNAPGNGLSVAVVAFTS